MCVSVGGNECVWVAGVVGAVQAAPALSHKAAFVWSYFQQ